jgi:hypothetical protein
MRLLGIWQRWLRLKERDSCRFATPAGTAASGEEFKRNVIAMRQPGLNGYDDAILLPVISSVRYHYSSAGLDISRH